VLGRGGRDVEHCVPFEDLIHIWRTWAIFHSPASCAGKTSTPERAAPTFENQAAQHAEKALADLRKPMARKPWLSEGHQVLARSAGLSLLVAARRAGHVGTELARTIDSAFRKVGLRFRE